MLVALFFISLELVLYRANAQEPTPAPRELEESPLTEAPPIVVDVQDLQTKPLANDSPKATDPQVGINDRSFAGLAARARDLNLSEDRRAEVRFPAKKPAGQSSTSEEDRVPAERLARERQIESVIDANPQLWDWRHPPQTFRVAQNVTESMSWWEMAGYWTPTAALAAFALATVFLAPKIFSVSFGLRGSGTGVNWIGGIVRIWLLASLLWLCALCYSMFTGQVELDPDDDRLWVWLVAVPSAAFVLATGGAAIRWVMAGFGLIRR
jgi:hypothetical protein